MAHVSTTPTRGEKMQMGEVCAARLNMATDPSNADTVTIGGHVFKFLTTLIAADTTTQVTRGVSAAATRAAFIDAINGTANVLVVPATTPHTLALLADEVDTSRVRIRQASSKGGSVRIAAPTSVAVSESLTNASDVWDCANMNETGCAPGLACQMVRRAITATMITATKTHFEFPFTPTKFVASVKLSTGGHRVLDADDLFTISGNAIKLTLAGGAAPDIQATDIVQLWASE